MYENNWEAENEDQLQKKIHSCVRKVDKNLVQCMYKHVYRKVNTVCGYGKKALFQS